MASDVQVFEFEGRRVRTITDGDGEPWFVAVDVCSVLGLGNPTQALARLDEDEKSSIHATLITDEGRPGQGAQSFTIVNEAGLYRLVLGSRKPEARRFKRWVVHELLPTIRKTGAYVTDAAAASDPILTQAQMLIEMRLKQIAQEQHLAAIEQRIDTLPAPTTHLSVLAFANLSGIRLDNRLASVLGKHCAAWAAASSAPCPMTITARSATIRSPSCGRSLPPQASFLTNTCTERKADGGDSFGRRRHRPHHNHPMEVFMATMTLTKLEANASVASPAPLEAVAAGTPAAPVILALDLGQRTGWAVRNRDGAIASGVHEFRPGRFEGGGMIWLRFRSWLQEIDETVGKVGVVVFEEVRRHAGTAAGHAYGGYLAHLTAWAEANRIPYQGVPVGTIKRHIAGKGNTDKAAVIAAVTALGFNPVDDNEADALALLHWAIVRGIGGAR